MGTAVETSAHSSQKGWHLISLRVVSLYFVSILAALISGSACGSDNSDSTEIGDGGEGPDSGLRFDAGGEDCDRSPGPDTKTRYIVASTPYGEMGPQSLYRVIKVDSEGALELMPEPFEMGRSTAGEILFTPDGKVGYVAQEDGSLGIFSLSDEGEIEVLESSFSSEEFYASSLAMSPDGKTLYVLEYGWRNVGGGVHRFDIACDGQLSNGAKIAESKLPSAMVWQSETDAVLLAHDLLESELDQDAHLWSPASSQLQSSERLFPDRMASISSAAITADNRFLLVGDNSEFSGVPNRIAIGEIVGGSIVGKQLIEDFLDPYSIRTDPAGEGAAIISGYGNGVFFLPFEGSSDSPFGEAVEVQYQGGRPQLPGASTGLSRGSLAGWIWIAETNGVRGMRFDSQGLEDQGVFPVGVGAESAVGAIGVQP